MAKLPKIEFASLDAPAGDVLVVLAGEGGSVPEALPGALREAVAKAAKIAKFKGKSLSTVDLIAPAGVEADRLLVLGTHAKEARTEEDFLKLGGTVAAKTKGATTRHDPLRDAGGRGLRRGRGQDGERGAAAGLCLRPLQVEEGQAR